jgi:hypothetical protein
MEKLQHDISPSMRGILIDWLVEVSAVSYIDIMAGAASGICLKQVQHTFSKDIEKKCLILSLEKKCHHS